jgi:CRP-like cAMP-binding protein
MELADIVNAYISKYVTLSEAELKLLMGMFEYREYKKKQLLIAEGEVELHLNFILKGLARKFFLRKKGEVVVTQFARENELISCYSSFLSGKPSNYSVETLEPTCLIAITRENVDRLYDMSPRIERLGRLITTEQFVNWEEFDYDRLRLTSSERFLNFVRNNSDLMQRVPQKYLASYLNMKPETFSRLKHLMKRPS